MSETITEQPEYPFVELSNEVLVQRIRQIDEILKTTELEEEDRVALDRECKHMVFEHWARKRNG